MKVGPQPSDEPEYNRWLRYFDDTTGRWLDTSVLHTNEGDNWPAAILPWFEKIYTWTGLHDKKAVELLQSIADEFKQQALPRLWEILNNMHTENLSYSWNRNGRQRLLK